MFKGMKMGNSLTLGKVITALFYTSMVIASFLGKGNSFQLGNFNKRIISQGTVDGIDINARNTFYYQAVMIALISFAVFLLIYIYGEIFLKNRLKEKWTEDFFAFEQQFCSALSLIGIITFLFSIFGTQYKTTIHFILCFQLLILLISFLRFFANRVSWQSLTMYLSNQYFTIWLFLNSFVFMFYLDYLGKAFSIFNGSHLLRNYLIGFILNFAIFFVVFLFLSKKNTYVNKAHFLIIVCTFPIFISPFFIPFANELYLILNQRGIFLLSPRKILFCCLIVSLFAAGIIYWFTRKRNVSSINIGRILGIYFYPFLLAMFVAVLFQPAATIGPPGELFESGNPGVTIDQLFRYGKIPLLETFNAHALSELYAPFIFSILNGYQKWGSILYNNLFDNTIYILVGYFFLRKVLSNELAFLTLAFLPFGVLSTQLMPLYFSVGLIAALAVFQVIKSPNLKNYLIFYFGIFFTFLWRFDLGASAIPAALIALFLYWFVYKKKLNIKNLILAGVITGLFWLGAFVLLCIVKNIPVVFRLKELMSVVSSNQVWGLTSLGDSSKLGYYLFYFIGPALNVLVLGYIIIKAKFVEKCKPEVFVLITFLAIFTLLNLPRGLVRHSLEENTSLFIVSFLGLSLCCLPFLKDDKKPLLSKYLKFLVISIVYAYIVISNNPNPPSNLSDNSLFGQTADRFSSFTDYAVANKKIERYSEAPEYSLQVYKGLKELFDQTMGPNETFIDFSNAPLLYMYTSRETPMYINQTPAYLSDEITQLSFLKEIQNYSIPYVIFPDQRGFAAIDGVPNQIRSYRVAEYIFNHYEPFTKLNGFDVWISKNKKSTIEDKLDKLSKQPNVISLYPSNTKDTSKLSMYGINSARETKEGLNLDAGNNDPQVSNFFGNATINEFPLKESSKNELEIIYSTKKAGTTQIYLKLDNEPFSDANSIAINSDGSNINEIKMVRIPLSGILQDIRIDPPSNNTFVLHSLKLKETPDVYKKLSVPSGKEKANIGWVPFYWGEKDQLNASAKAPIEVKVSGNQTLNEVPASFQINRSFDKSKGNYLLLRLKSANISNSYNATVKFGDNLKANAASYTFKIQADGKYHDYLIRVSSQYNWYRLPVKFINISTKQETEMKNLSILKGD